MSNLNISVKGTVGKDAKLHGKARHKILTFSLAVSDGFGEKKVTTWFDVKCFIDTENEKVLKAAERALEHIHKGDLVVILGIRKISTRVYNDEATVELWVNSPWDIDTVRYKNPPGEKPAVTDAVADDGIPVPEQEFAGDDLPF